jgi:hypothetical protein
MVNPGFAGKGGGVFPGLNRSYSCGLELISRVGSEVGKGISECGLTYSPLSYGLWVYEGDGSVC